MKKASIIAAALWILIFSVGCKSPDQIEQDVRDSKSTQEIVIKQELEREIRTLSIVGVGKVDVTPDVATITLRATSIDATAEQVREKNYEEISAVLAAIKACGIQDNHIKTQEAIIFPMHDNDKAPSEITGYTATNTIVVHVNNVRDTGEVVMAAMQAGANELLQVEFHLSDDTDAYMQALAAAVAIAQGKAEVMAPALGATLNGPGTVVENINATLNNNVVSYETPLDAEQAGSSNILTTPLQAGQITVTAQVTIEYMLKYPMLPTPTPAA